MRIRRAKRAINVPDKIAFCLLINFIRESGVKFCGKDSVSSLLQLRQFVFFLLGTNQDSWMPTITPSIGPGRAR